MSSKKIKINIDTASGGDQVQAPAIPLSDHLKASLYVTPTTPLTPGAYEYRDPKDFNLVLVDINFELCKQFKLHFGKFMRRNHHILQQQQAQSGQAFPKVQIKCLRFEDLNNFDCMVSAANSFGLMDGGIDASITHYFGDQVEMRVQQHILRYYDGEQPVGTSFIIPTHHQAHPYLAHTPTLRVPYSIQQTDYVYLAMKSMLRAVADHNERALMDPENYRFIETVACPGLGTSSGKMELEEAARQMSLAYENFYLCPRALDWGYANEIQRRVVWGGNPENGVNILKRKKEREQEIEPYTPITAPTFTEELQEDSKAVNISKMDFYNLVILNDFLIVDARSESDQTPGLNNAVRTSPESITSRQDLEHIKWPSVELAHTVLIYHGDVSQEKEGKHLNTVVDYFSTKRGVKTVYVLADRFESFTKDYSFLCQESNDTYPSHLLPNLFLGSQLVASNEKVLKQLGITHLLNCDREKKSNSDALPGFEYLQLNCDETDEREIRRIFSDGSDFINKSQKVLVYCNRGENKSPCVAIVYLMQTLMWTWDEAMAYVKRARQLIEPKEQLAAVAKQIEVDSFNTER
ncbi:dual specificity protein phosphatase [Acrasis kona]|uniref:protein-tyrosine-phosphatase n=1 Tax=Acrasis kona TaxID=1008807 RepID=A0AAW2ZFH7_9EUKA